MEGIGQGVGIDCLVLHLKHGIEKGELEELGYYVEHGQLYYKWRLVISQQSLHIPKILYEYHNFVIGGYNGETKMYNRIASNLCWVGMKG